MRLPPPERSSLDSDVDELLSLAVAPSGETAQTIAVLAHSPALVAPFLGWAMALHTQGVLSQRVHEIVALRVAHLCGSAYEWDEHTRWATDAGLTGTEIRAVAAGPAEWAPADAAVISAVDELHTVQDLSDQTFTTLRRHLDEAAVVEMIMVVGQYTTLSMLATTTGGSSRRRPPTEH